MKSYDEGEEISELGNWNTASDYARLKIMRPLYLADEYETIATFGSIDFYDENLNNDNVDAIRLKGFTRLVKTLTMVINNSMFAIRIKKEKEKLEGYLVELKRFYKVIPALYKNVVDQRKGNTKLILKSDNFEKALERVCEIKSLINEPLNRHDLIFTYKEEFNPLKAKEDLFQRLTERG